MPLNVPLNIKLHANQQHVHDNARRYNVLMCGKRWGKSRLALFRAIQKAGQHPNGVIWIVSPTYRQSKQIAWWDLIRFLPPQLIRRKIETELFIELFNGARIQLVGADSEDNLRGPKLDHIVIDEAAYVKDHVWSSILSGQLLGNAEQGAGTADFISSPSRTGRNWFSAFHADAKKRMEDGDPDWAAFFYTIYDNPTLSKEDIDKLKANTPDDTWALEYMAQESDFSGQKYSEFVYERHVSTYTEPAENLPTYRALDFGILHPTVCLWAKVDRPNGLVYIYDEFCRSGLVIEETTKIVHEKTGSTQVIWSVCDPSMNRRDVVTGRSVKDEFSRCGLFCVDGDRRGADNIGGRGTDIVKNMLRKSMIRISPKCKNLILELRNLQWGDKLNDDCCDALRYLLVRLHDLVFNGVLPDLATPQAPLVAKHTFNLNDPVLFPKRSLEFSSSIREQLNEY